MSSKLPPTPDFDAIEAAAPASADRRTTVLALIGNMVFCWSNNESLLIYVLMLLLNSDEVSATVVFGTLNTTRARLDLIQRLARVQIKDPELHADLTKLIDGFNDSTRVRNEFNHCMYSVDDQGVITHTQSIRIADVRGRLNLGSRKPVDDKRIAEMVRAIHQMKKLNRTIWSFLPRLDAHLSRVRGAGARSSGAG